MKNKLINVPYSCTKDCPDHCAFFLDSKHRPIAYNPELYMTGDSFLKESYRSVCHKLSGFIESEGKRSEEEIQKAKNSLIKLAKLIQSGKKILYYRGSGSVGIGVFIWDFLFSKFKNISFVDGAPCLETGVSAHEKDFGVCVNPPIENIQTAERVILWGKNAQVTSVHLYRYLKNLKEKKNFKILCIDPIHNKTCDIADEYISISPGSDGAFAYLALKRYKNKNFDGIGDQFFNDILSKDYFSQKDLDTLYEFILPGKTAFIVGSGLQRYANGENSVRLINRLGVLTGNVDLTYYYRSSKGHLPLFQEMQELLKDIPKINIEKIPASLQEKKFEGIIVVASNPVATLPLSNVWRKFLKGMPSFVIDPIFSETAQYSQYHIPVDGMIYQKEEASGSYFFPGRSFYHNIHSQNLEVNDSDKGNVFNDGDAALFLSQKLNINIQKFIDAMQKIPEKTLFEEKKRLPLQDENLLPHLPDQFTEKKSFPLRVLSNSSMHWLNSQLTEHKGNRKKKNYLFISPQFAQIKNVQEGEKVVVYNEHGEIKAELKLDSSLKKYTAYTYKGKKLVDDYINALIPSIGTDAGNGLALYDTWVDLRKIQKNE